MGDLFTDSQVLPLDTARDLLIPPFDDAQDIPQSAIRSPQSIAGEVRAQFPQPGVLKYSWVKRSSNVPEST